MKTYVNLIVALGAITLTAACSQNSGLLKNTKWVGYRASNITSICSSQEKEFTPFINCLIKKQEAAPDNISAPAAELFMREELIRLVSEANTKLLENQKEIREQGWIRRTFWAVDPLDQSSLISEINIALSSYLPIARTSAREFEKQQAQIAYEKRDRALQNLMFMYGNMLQAQPKRINCHSSKFGSQYTTNCTY